jgi:hypothetical protein
MLLFSSSTIVVVKKISFTLIKKESDALFDILYK